MQSTALLHGGIVGKLPSRVSSAAIPATAPASRLGLKSSYVSSVWLSNKGNYSNHSNAQTWNRNNICCKIFRRSSSFSRDDSEKRYLKTKEALETLLSISVDGSQRTGPQMSVIDNEKRRALQSIINGQREQAKNIMTGVYQKYEREGSKQYQHDAGLAVVEILIHLGTKESWQEALDYLNKVQELDPIISDAKLPLYRAILSTLLGKHRDAKNWWAVYVNSIGIDPF